MRNIFNHGRIMMQAKNAGTQFKPFVFVAFYGTDTGRHRRGLADNKIIEG